MNGVFKLGALAAIAGLSLATVVARADAGSWEIRLRGIRLSPQNDSDAYLPLAIPKNSIHINGRWLPDVDIEHFFTPRWSAELVVTYPQKQTVTVEHSALGGPINIGTFKHLPPTLTAKYNFAPGETFQPYIGAGLNLTVISDVKLNVPTVGRLELDHTSVGPAVQAGFDYEVAAGWFLNADVKWVMIRSDVRFQGAKISEARLDPVLIGVGVGYRFH